MTPFHLKSNSGAGLVRLAPGLFIVCSLSLGSACSEEALTKPLERPDGSSGGAPSEAGVPLPVDSGSVESGTDGEVVKDASSVAPLPPAPLAWCPPECSEGLNCFDALGLGVCVDLSNTVKYPGPCGATVWSSQQPDDGEIGACTIAYDPLQRPARDTCGADKQFTYDDDGVLVRVDEERFESSPDEDPYSVCTHHVLHGDQVTRTTCTTSTGCALADEPPCGGNSGFVTQYPAPIEVGLPWQVPPDDEGVLVDAAGNVRYVVRPEGELELQVWRFNYECWEPTVCTEPLSFTDSTLAEAVREQLELDGELISTVTAAELTALEVNGVTWVHGIECLPNLTHLDIGGALTDVGNLGVLEDLESLRIRWSAGQPWSLGFLQTLTRLELLDFAHGKMTDLATLPQLPSLIELHLEDNLLWDMSGLHSLAQLDSLQYLNLAINSVNDISTLSELTSLRELHLAGNRISDIEPLAKLGYLHTLDLGGNAVSDISALSGLTDLVELSLDSNAISDITPLSGMLELERLDLQRNPITDIAPLNALSNLKKLTMTGNSSLDLQPLVDNPGLGAGDEVVILQTLDCEVVGAQIDLLQNRGVDIITGCNAPY